MLTQAIYIVIIILIILIYGQSKLVTAYVGDKKYSVAEFGDKDVAAKRLHRINMDVLAFLTFLKKK